MRPVTRLLTVILTCAATSTAMGQQIADRTTRMLLRRQAHLDVHNVALDAALGELQLRSGVSIAFSPDLARQYGSVSCSCESVTVGAALDSLLRGTQLGYAETTNRVIVAPVMELHATTGAMNGDVVIGPQSSQQAATLVGFVRSAADSQPIVGAWIRVPGRMGDARTDAQGRFTVFLDAGLYDLTVRAVGYGAARVMGVRVGSPNAEPTIVHLQRANIRLADIVVSPSTYAILDAGDVITQQTMTREDIRTRPGFGEDIYRAMHRLPGVASDDISAKIHIRGSSSDQVLQTLDGLEVYEPFHLKEIDGGFSIIDVESVNDVDLMTGGFTAEHGDKLAGVFGMRTTTPIDRTTTTLGLSLQNVSVKSEGGFGGGKGRWLASARRGYLDLILAITDATDPGVELSPMYYDVFAKAQYQLNPNHLVSFHLLHAGDDFAVVEEDATELDSKYNSNYGWVSWHAGFTDALTAETMLSVGRTNRTRDGRDFFDGGEGAQSLLVDHDETFDVIGIKQDWSLMASDRWLIKWGFDLKRGFAEYDYFRWYTDFVPETENPFAPQFYPVTDTLVVTADPSGTEAGLYLSNRVRPVEAVTAEVGVRYDYQSHTDDEMVSPRVNLALQLTPQTTLRGAWGYFFQSHGLHELMVADGDDTFYAPQRAEHRIVGLEQRLRDGTSFRVEAYQRLVTDPRPEYRSLEPQYETVWEEGPDDRVRLDPTRSEARGIEFFAKHDVGGKFAWSAGYALAEAVDEIDAEWVPRPYDQRHSVQFDFAYRPNALWSLSWAWQFHSGWPNTPQTWTLDSTAAEYTYFTRTFAPLNGDRLPAYHRLDIRASRHFPVGRGRLSVFLDIFNLYDRENAKAYDYSLNGVSPGTLNVVRWQHDLIGVLPTIGVRWEF
jgi:hypothetical protein